MTVTVTPTVENSNVPPRIRLDVAADAGETSTTITRLDPDGRLITVRTADGAAQPITSGTALLYDYEAPFGQAVSYSTLESPSTVSAQVAVDSASVWLIHPGIPDLSMPVELRVGSLQEEVSPVRQGVFYPMGRTNPVVITDGVRHGIESSMTVAIESLSALADIRALIWDAGVLLLNIPVSLGFGFPTSYIAVGDVTISRPSTIGSDPTRDVRMPFRVVDRPVGGSQASRTYVDLLTGYATYTALLAGYDDYLDVLAGP